MAKIFEVQRKSTLALRQRRQALGRQGAPSRLVRASVVEQYFTCGKANCVCQRGKKHGPYYYLMACLTPGTIRKFRLKTPTQLEQARRSTAAYVRYLEQLEELSQINAELLRRGEEWSVDL